jgi:hypothetical protein
MIPARVDLLVEPGEIHDYVLGLWSDGPIRRSHAAGGYVADLVGRFARIPRFFYRAADQHIEWTHFSTWWGGILLCDYDNETIRDLRYLHEIHHGATMPYIRDANLPTLEAMNFRNEREASTFTEMAVYLELPDLRPLAFDHPLFVDRFLFPGGDLSSPDPAMLARWRSEPDSVFQELMYERTRVILAEPGEIDPGDPQVVWLRRYSEQGANWIQVWKERFRLVQHAMLDLRAASRAGDRAAAARRHLDWLFSDPIAEGTGVPFHREAAAFRGKFDALIAAYDRAMRAADQVAVRGKGEGGE